VSADDYQDDSGSYPDPNASDSNYDYRAADNRQVLEQDYRAGLNRQSEQAAQQEQNSQSRPEKPVAAQPSTVLVFKDGHQQEVSNYAIIGATLYELSDGRSKKVQLTDLDLTATVKENDQRGVAFQLPAGAKFN
jgi:sRNA-binding protein